MLTLTPKAADKIRSFISGQEDAKGKALRLGLRPSGCAGFEYVLGFDEKKDGDKVLPQEGFEVVVDAEAYGQLDEAVVDYRDDPMSSGFKISNPKEKSSCGCGKSKQF